MLKFCIKVFRTSLFPNPMMDLVHIWYDDRYWSKILHSTIPTPIHDLKVMVTDRTFMLKFYVKVFRTSLFPNPVVYLFHVWYDDRCWSKILCSMIPSPVHALSKILCSTIPIPVHDLKIKVTDFEFFCVKSLQCQLLQSLWLIWIVFGMNEYKILKCFRKEKRVSGELPCPATGLIQ